MPTAERTALVVTTPTAASSVTNGGSLRVDEVVAALSAAGYGVRRTQVRDLDRVPGQFDLGVAVSYTTAPAVRTLQLRAGRVWLDAVDSWLLVNGSGMRSGRPSYLVRAVRDGARLARAAAPDLVTYISAADLERDGRTVRGARRLVLPARAAPAPGRASSGRRVVLTGDWDYPPNRHGLMWFTRRVLPLLQRSSADEIPVVVYGPGGALRGVPALRQLGYAADPSELYLDGDVHAAPVHFGAGVKRKVLQPLVAGLPVVTTAAGAHGLRAHPLLDVCGSAHDFASALAARLAQAPVRRAAALSALVDRDDSLAVMRWLRT